MNNDKQLCIGFTHFDPRFAFFWSIVSHCAQEEAERLGVKLISKPAPFVADQIIEIQKLLEQKIDALLITPIESDHPGLIDVIKTVNAAGIPVVALDSGVGGGQVMSTVRSDNIKGEEMVAEYIFERLGGKGKVAHLQGDLKVEVGAHRSEGFHNVLSRYPEIELVFEAEGNWYRDRGAELTQQALAQHPDIQAVIAANDLTALGAGDVIAKAGRTKEILVAGFDALPEALLSIYAGQMTATVQQDAEGMAREALQAAIQGIRGEAVPSLLLTKVELITLDNLLKTTVNGLHMLPGVLRNLEEQKLEISKANALLEQHRDQLEKLVADRTYELTRQQYILDTFMDNIPDRIYFKDTQSRVTRANRAFVIKLGVQDSSELIGKSDFDFFPEDQAEIKYQQEQEIIKTGQPILGLEEPDGIDLWALTTKMPLRDENGIIIGTFGISRDITELVKTKRAAEVAVKEADKALALAEAEKEKAEHRAHQLQLAAQVSRATSSTLDVDELLPQLVELIRDRFNLYYVGLFLVDEAEEYAVLRAGTGETGRQMIEAGHQLEVGGSSMIGWCVANAQARIALDVGKEAVRFNNPLLPQTHSELALPLVGRGRVIGALTIQSAQSAAFTQEDISVLQTLADQLANAIENARLFTERTRTEKALVQEQSLMHALMANVPDYIYFKDRESRFIRTSKAHAQSFGLNDPVQAVGKTDFDFFTEEHARPAYEDEQAIIRTGQPITQEEKETRPDQPDRWVVTTKLPLRDETGNTVGTFGISRDITERKQAEIKMQAALAETEALYRLSSSIISFKDLPDLLQTVTDNVAKLLPADRVSLISFDLESRAVTHFMRGGPGSSDVVTTVEYNELQDGLSGWVFRELKPALSLKNVPDSRESLAVQQRRRETNCGAIIVTPLIYHDRLLGTLTAINRPDEANFTQKDVELMMAMANQAAAAIENARLLEQMQASEAQLRTLIENAPEAILVLDTDTGLFLSSNENATKLYGLDREALTKVGLVDMSPPNQPDGRPSAQALSEYITAALNGGTPDFEWIHCTAAGQLIPCEVRLVRMPAAGHSLIRVSVNDITIRRQGEIQMQETLHELERLYRATAREGWQAYREAAQTTPGYLFDRISLTPQDSWGPQLEQGIQQATRTLSIGEQSVAVTPLAVRGEVIGAVGVYDDPNHPLSPDELALIQEIAEQGALALESARLFDQTQRDADRERTINRITGRIRGARSVDEVLTVATQELRLATQASRSVVDIKPHARADTSPAAGNGEHQGVKA